MSSLWTRIELATAPAAVTAAAGQYSSAGSKRCDITLQLGVRGASPSLVRSASVSDGVHLAKCNTKGCILRRAFGEEVVSLQIRGTQGVIGSLTGRAILSRRRLSSVAAEAAVECKVATGGAGA